VLWIDWLIVGLIGVSALVSLIRGFVAEALSILIWIAALWAAFQFTEQVSAEYFGTIEEPSMRLAVAALVLILGVLVLGSLLSWAIARLVRSTGLAGTDRLLGMLFGAARGVITVIALVAVASWTPLCRDSWWRASTLIPAFESLGLLARDFLPPALREIMGGCQAGAPLPGPELPAPAPSGGE
jgi:membrane protein required for colicin V production